MHNAILLTNLETTSVSKPAYNLRSIIIVFYHRRPIDSIINTNNDTLTYAHNGTNNDIQTHKNTQDDTNTDMMTPTQ